MRPKKRTETPPKRRRDSARRDAPTSRDNGPRDNGSRDNNLRDDSQRPNYQRPDYRRPDYQRPDNRRNNNGPAEARRPNPRREDPRREDPRREDPRRTDTRRVDTRRTDTRRTEPPRGDSRRQPDPDQPKLKTLERILSKAGVGSRTDARTWIGQGRVHVNGRRIENPDHWVDVEKDRVSFDGRPLRAPERLYILLYKPTGYLTTYRDPEGRPTVYDLLRQIPVFLGNVGRLDLDTSGLLLLTNDTGFAELMTNPDYHVPKTYQVKASRLLSDQELDQLRQGITLDDGPTRPAQVERLRDSGKYTHFTLTITEGRNRQVRRMVEALGAVVLKLVRIRIGDIAIGDLPIGSWRHLEREELEALRRLARGNRPKSAR